jgi:hypothetical protein
MPVGGRVAEALGLGEQIVRGDGGGQFSRSSM